MRNFREKPIRPEERELLFCVYCDQSRSAFGDMAAHLKMAHEVIVPEVGRDYLSVPGIERRLAEEDEAADRFDRSFESLRGVEDFLLECGDA